MKAGNTPDTYNTSIHFPTLSSQTFRLAHFQQKTRWRKRRTKRDLGGLRPVRWEGCFGQEGWGIFNLGLGMLGGIG